MSVTNRLVEAHASADKSLTSKTLTETGVVYLLVCSIFLVKMLWSN